MNDIIPIWRDLEIGEVSDPDTDRLLTKEEGWQPVDRPYTIEKWTVPTQRRMNADNILVSLTEQDLDYILKLILNDESESIKKRYEKFKSQGIPFDLSVRLAKAECFYAFIAAASEPNSDINFGDYTVELVFEPNQKPWECSIEAASGYYARKVFDAAMKENGKFLRFI